MKSLLAVALASILPVPFLFAADLPAAPAAPPPATPAADKPVLKIIPGQVVVPTADGLMRRIWGELISVDLSTRTGKFRQESTDQVLNFTVMPYAELLHHASFGDLPDFRIGERAIFRLHQNTAGEWVWLTYIQDEMNFLNGHKEYYYVDRIDADKGELECTDANFDKSFVREKGILIETDKDTRYWKQGQPVKFSDIQVGDKLRTKTHGIGKGKVRVCWEIFLDDASLLKFQTEQKAAEAKRLQEEGSPGYVDKLDGGYVDLTLFQESGDLSHKLKPGMKVRVAPAGVDRKAIGASITGSVAAAKMAGNLGKVTITLDGKDAKLVVGNVARVWETP
ncbi:MAG: hypothetical protein P4L99_26660 [Chthoniobacter sp.]|nr:hypothetical protein [Chthoniobacter sp.]